MGSDKKFSEFPDVENKLQAPTKKSLFERQKAEAEAKRLKEEAETKAVYDDFVKSFDDEDLGGPEGGNGGGRFGGFAGSGPPKRHFGGGMGQTGGSGFSAPNTPAGGRGFVASGGRGSSGPGSLGPQPSSLSKKRTFDGFQQRSRRDDRGVLAFDDYEPERDREPKKVFHTSDDEDERGVVDRGEEKAVAKPTLRLASLPPGTSPAVIKALLPSSLTVDAVSMLPYSAPPTGSERKSVSAIVTLAQDTPANDIESTVNSLQNRYLGYGYYLSLHRHLSSAAISAVPITSLGTSTASHPFGAKAVSLAPAGRGHAPPPHQRGFAPPTSYAPTGPGFRNNDPILHVPVQAPQDIKQLRLIHKTIESLLSHGPEFEALLMSRPSVQREEKWAWLWDPRSVGGVWYRWRLWQVLTGTSASKKGTQGKYLPLFEGSSAWKAPDQGLAWEYTTQLTEFVSDSEYNSSDDDESGDEGQRRPHHQGAGGPPDTTILSAVDEGKAYLNPLEKAKLTHLLSRLPTSIGTLRKGDVARVTAFAISHAGRGADEVVSLLISNIETPFAYTSANPLNSKSKDKAKETATTGSDPDNDNDSEEDTSSASLIALYLVSDILSSSSTSGVRHAWRYRQLFEHALKARHIFSHLGRLERKLKWGRLRGEKWKRSVGMLLGLWEGWCVFPTESQEYFARVFREPPKEETDDDEGENGDGDEQGKKRAQQDDAGRGKSRWKAVDDSATAAQPTSFSAPEAEQQHPPRQDSANNDMEMEIDNGEEEEDADIDGEPMLEDDEDLDGEPMLEDDYDDNVEDGDGDHDVNGDGDGEPMQQDDDPQSAGRDNTTITTATTTAEEGSAPAPPAAPQEGRKADEARGSLGSGEASGPGAGPRRRPRAVDMFADSDDDDEGS